MTNKTKEKTKPTKAKRSFIYRLCRLLILLGLLAATLFFLVLPKVIAYKVEQALTEKYDVTVAIGTVTFDFDKRLVLNNLRIRNSSDQRLLTVGSCKIIFNENPMSGNVNIQSITINDSGIYGLRNPKGQWNWAGVIKETDKTAKPLDMDKLPQTIEIKNLNIHTSFMDQAQDHSDFDVTDINGTLKRDKDQYKLGVVTGMFCDGTVKLLGNLSPVHKSYDIAIDVDDAQIEKLFLESPDAEKKVTGIFDLGIRYTKKPDQWSVHNMKGTLTIRNAKLWQLTLFEELLSVLQLDKMKLTVFDTAEINFSYHGSILSIQNATFMSNTLSFYGQGQIHPTGEIDFSFVPRFGKKTILEYIPIIGKASQNVLDKIKQQVIKVKITGTLFKPKTTIAPLDPITNLPKNLLNFLK